MSSSDRPLVSVLIPARNEARCIEDCLTSLMHGSYPVDCLEVIVLDGCSTDGTAEVVRRLIDSEGWSQVQIVENPGKTQSSAMNLGVQMCSGEYVARLDAHSKYPGNYIEKLVDYLCRYPDVDNVGGVCKVIPGANTLVARAIAAAYSHWFATGNALWRTGIRKPTFVDTVPFGFFRRAGLLKFGPFDEELIRNEDQEYNHRIIASGGKVLLVPDVVVSYFARPTLRLMARMFFQYGLFKPLSQAKQRRIVSIRQFAPIAFLLALFALVISRNTLMIDLAIGLAAGYAATSVFAAIGSIRKAGERLSLVPLVCVAFWTMHLSFAIGNVRGFIEFLILGKRVHDVPPSR